MRIFKVVLAAALVIALLGAGYLLRVATQRLNPGPDIYEVTPGMTLHGFNRELQRRGVTSDAYSLVILAYLRGKSRHLQAGEYRFRPGITAFQLLDQVVSGRVVEYPLVFVEGWTFKEMMKAMDAAPKLAHTLAGLSDAQIMARLGYPGIPPEGRFYPDTYYYSLGTTDVQILRRAYDRMAEALAQEWGERDPTVPLKTPEDALTLASIIEKETGQPSERPLIAGVFINRLRIGMKLQTDPTVIYGMGDRYHGDIRTADLRRNTPYNTYVHYGLPPTPIAMPSIQSLRAALHPAKTKDLYFVSRGDGTHVFSETLAEHDRAVRKYQIAPHAQHTAAARRVVAHKVHRVRAVR